MKSTKMSAVALLVALALLPSRLLAGPDGVSYLPSIGVSGRELSKDGGEVRLRMELDLSGAHVRTQHTVALVPVLVSRDGSREVQFPHVVIDGRTRNRVYLRSERMRSVDAPAYHEGGPQQDTIILRRNGTEQVYSYSAGVPYRRWMLDGRVELREYVHGCVNCSAGESSDGLLDDVLPEYEPSYRTVRIEPQPEPVKVRDESRSARLQFLVDKYDILPNYRNNRRELDDIFNSIEIVKDDRDLEIIGIYITGYASPEGTVAHNLTLSENRAKSLADYICRHDRDISPDMIHVDWRGEDWEGLRGALDLYPGLLKREEVLRIMDEHAGEDQDQVEQLFRRIEPGDVYKRLVNEVYPHLRRNDYRIEYNVRNFNLEEARALLHERPELLSLSEIYKVAGSYEHGSGQYNDAMSVAARLYPHEPAVTNDRLLDAIASGDYAGAVSIGEGAECGMTAQLQNSLGVAYALSGRLDDAVRVLSEAAAAGSAEAAHNLDEVRAVMDQLDPQE